MDLARRLACHVACLALAAGSCRSFQAIEAPIRPSAIVRVRFLEPRPIRLTRIGSDTATVVRVSAIEGNVLAVEGDTIRLAPTRIRVGDGDPEERVAGRYKAAIPMTGAIILERRLSAGRTAIAVAATITTLAVVYVTILFYAIATTT